MGASENINRREFQVFVKPAGALCNLRCTYCYYLEKKELYADSGIRVMDDAILELYTKSQVEATTEPVITFSWHGGEPILAGIDFYRRAVSVQKKYCPPGKKIINGIQTNGTLLSDDWCSFFAEENFIVGISMDGPENMHDFFRKGRDGKGSFQEVLKGFDRLVMHGTEPEILCVVNSHNSRYPAEVYGFFKRLGVSYITFIPLVEHVNSSVTDRSVVPEAFGDFLCSVFDEWVASDIGKIKIQIIEETLRSAFNQPHTLCIFRPECGGVPVMEHNGDFFSCDHFVSKDYRVGNIRTTTVAEMLDSESQQSFGRTKRDSLPSYCRKCEVLAMCNGECPKNRFMRTRDGEPGLNYLCAGYRKFFNHCKPLVDKVGEVANFA